MLLARPINGPSSFQWTGLGATPLPQTHTMPGSGSGTAPTASEFKPPPTGMVRGDWWYQEGQYLGRMTRQRDQVAEILRGMYATGELKSCWDPTFGLKAIGSNWLSPMIAKIFPITTLEEACGFYGSEASDHDRYLRVPGHSLTDPVGVIVDYTTLGVPFTPDELRLGNPTHPDEVTLERTYMPTDDQRWLADRAIYTRSQIELADRYYGVDLSDRSNLNEILADNTDAKGIIGLLTRDTSIGGFVITKSSSIKHFINAVKLGNEPLFTTHLDGYGHNPIVPTDEEVNGNGGLYNYYKRGGYLLSKNAARGIDPVVHGPLRFTQSFCMADKCSSSAATNQLPRPIPIQTKFIGEARGWVTFIKISPSGYTIRIQAKERSTADKIASAISGFVERLVKWACQAAPAILAYNQSLPTTPVCKFPDGTPCAQGQTKGVGTGAQACVCTGPTDGQLLARGAAGAFVGVLCGAVTPAPTPAPPINITMPPATNYWPWIIGGGVLLAAIAASRR